MDDEPNLAEPELPEPPPQHASLKRLAAFLRSVIPADPWQLAYLVAIVFVLILGALPLLPDDLLKWSQLFVGTGGSSKLSSLIPYVLLCAWVSLAASCVGFFTCFWPGRKPALRIVSAVILPTSAVLALLVWKIHRLSVSTLSIFELQSIGSFFNWLRANIWRFPTGLYVGACGVALILIYAIRLAAGWSPLPISVNPTGLASQEEEEYWPRIQWLLFALFGAYIVISGLLLLPLSVIEWKLLTKFPSSVVFSVGTGVGRLLDAAVLLGISLFILGKQGREAAVKSLRQPEPRYALLGMLVPVVICGLVLTSRWTIDRILWAQHDIGLFRPPPFSDYFDLAHAWQPWLILVAVGAFVEEVVFRGVLLACLIKRYGLHRGIFFTGIAWAMIHFRSDRYSQLNVVGVLLQLTSRVAFCLAMNCVLAWMTLRWKSIIPAGLVHTVWNIFVMSGLVVSFVWNWPLEILLWAILAIVLWRYWPVESQAEDTALLPAELEGVT